MRFALFTVFACMAFASSAHAAADGSGLSEKPVCFTMKNFAAYTVFGTVITDTYTDLSGRVVKHQDNFRLEKGHYAEFCSSGPFFPGQKLIIQLRTLFPTFECRTKLTGTLAVRGTKKPEGGYKTWIDCID